MPKKRHIYRGINIVHPRAVPVIISLCRTARIAEIVNWMVKWNEANARVSSGLLIEALHQLHHVRQETALEGRAVLGRT